MKFVLEFKNHPLNPYKDQLTDEDYTNLENLNKRYQTHDLYPHIGTITTREKLDLGDYFKGDNYKIFRSKIGYVSGNKQNPLDRIYVYKTKEKFINGYNVQAKRINKKDISQIIPDQYQEYVLMIFRTDRNLDAIKADKELFQKIRESKSD
jgi:hypothetical protein